ncbi:hypothetical protein H920_01694 [Fukomys damarensis]|uniref:Uncharacterized protein n=1 Tax=Fukomys damarensis TaxID=885580 RepID=A0A091EMN3_FUKDA|nr:hypothetical protein H920_01694 [Fukomys damarensis]
MPAPDPAAIAQAPGSEEWTDKELYYYRSPTASSPKTAEQGWQILHLELQYNDLLQMKEAQWAAVHKLQPPVGRTSSSWLQQVESDSQEVDGDKETIVSMVWTQTIPEPKELRESIDEFHLQACDMEVILAVDEVFQYGDALYLLVVVPSHFQQCDLDGECLQEGNLVLLVQMQAASHLLGKVHNLLD